MSDQSKSLFMKFLNFYENFLAIFFKMSDYYDYVSIN